MKKIVICILLCLVFAALTVCSGCDANPFGGNGMDWTFNQSGHQYPDASTGDVVVTFDDDGNLESVKPGGGVANLIIVTGSAAQHDSGFMAGAETGVGSDPPNQPDEDSSQSPEE